MTKEEKVIKRKARAKRRADKHNEKYIKKIKQARDNNIPEHVPLSTVTTWGYASWEDPNSPTGRTQICSYFGTCMSPCNGDC